jgi:hypothetical protein
LPSIPKTFKLYDPAAHVGDPRVDPSRVGDWSDYVMKVRDLGPDINGVSWQPSSTATFHVVPAQLIGNLYYAYLDQYRGQLLDYYIEATDKLGNVTKSPIQQVYVGQGRFRMEGGKQVEDPNGDIGGTHPFFTDQPLRRTVTLYVQADDPSLQAPIIETKGEGTESWRAPEAKRIEGGSHTYFRVSDRYSEELAGLRLRYRRPPGGNQPSDEGQLFTEGTYTLTADGSVSSGKPADVVVSATIYYRPPDWSNVCLHYRVDEGSWTTVPGVTMQPVGSGWLAHTLDMDGGESVEFAPNDCAGRWDNNGGRNYQVGSGTWSLASGVITEGGPPDTGAPIEPDENMPPTAVITPADQQAEKGTVVTLSAADSTDRDGTIVGYLWSTGETTPSISITADETLEVTVTVTDDKQATGSTSATIRVPSQGRFESVYFRGTPNGWCTTPMELVADDTWQVRVDFDGSPDQRFKFDIEGDWSQYYGDNDADGTLERNGDHIQTDVKGPRIVELNSGTMTYTVRETGDAESASVSSR